MVRLGPLRHSISKELKGRGHTLIPHHRIALREKVRQPGHDALVKTEVIALLMTVVCGTRSKAYLKPMNARTTDVFLFSRFL